MRIKIQEMRRLLLWFGGVGLVFTGPLGLWLVVEGAVHVDRLLVLYWICAFIWTAAFTHWMLEVPEVQAT